MRRSNLFMTRMGFSRSCHACRRTVMVCLNFYSERIYESALRGMSYLGTYPFDYIDKD